MDAAPGLRRQRGGDGFRYLAADGSSVRERRTLARIRALAIPPAWTDVWICARDDGHLQATGRDARGRKQYRYHQRWREIRDETKYGRMIDFAGALPAIRRQAARDLARPGLPREKVLAAVVRLLETTFIRVGNEEYARENDSFGLTTLRDRQVRVRGATLKFRFRGKSGVEHEIALADPKLARIVRRMHELPGEELFQYVDADGKSRAIESTDVNAYLRSVAGEEFTSKDFRTWAGTVLCARALRRLEAPQSEADGKRKLAEAVESVARKLGNTKAVCRKCYIHPALIDTYMHGQLQEAMRARSEEAGVIALLRRPGTRFAVDLAHESVDARARGTRRKQRQLRRRPRQPAPFYAGGRAATARHRRAQALRYVAR
jgi:DNA topoisomerase-1